MRYLYKSGILHLGGNWIVSTKSGFHLLQILYQNVSPHLVQIFRHLANFPHLCVCVCVCVAVALVQSELDHWLKCSLLVELLSVILCTFSLHTPNEIVGKFLPSGGNFCQVGEIFAKWGKF